MIVSVFAGCHSKEPVTIIARTEGQRLITIRYCLKPSRTFEITGENIKGIKLDALTNVLKTHSMNHPRATYELYSEVKSVPEESEKIVETIRQAGIQLKHYWAPVSFIDPNVKPGPYGTGYVDILRREDR